MFGSIVVLNLTIISYAIRVIAQCTNRANDNFFLVFLVLLGTSLLRTQVSMSFHFIDV